MNNEFEWFYGAKLQPLDVENEIAWAENETLLKILSSHIRNWTLQKSNWYFIQWNQNRKKEHYWWCTYYSSCGLISDLFWLNQSQYYELTDSSIQEWIKEWVFATVWWWYTINAQSIAKKDWNRANPSKKVVFVYWEIWSSLFWTLASYWFSMTVTYIWWTDYSKDSADWRLDNTKFWNSKWGHCIRFKNVSNIWKQLKPEDFLAIDNYLKSWSKTEYKTYLIDKDNLPGLMQKNNWVYFDRFYCMLPADLF